MDIELVAGLVAFAALLIVWIGAPAGLPREEVGAVPAPAALKA